jgi:hypothetical protein
MRRISLFFVVALVAGLGPFAVAAYAHPTVRCTGTLASAHIPGNVVVPSGATCVLDGVYIGGNVTAQPSTHLTIGDGSIIKGNVTSVDGGGEVAQPAVTICDSKIEGNVKITDAYNAVIVGGRQSCAGNFIGGNVTLTGNTGGVYLENNGPLAQSANCRIETELGIRCRIGGNVVVSANNLAEVAYDKIYGDLSCRDNGSITERYNVVLGIRRGQCVTAP